MSWKEVNIVDLREEFILRSFTKQQPFSSLCREYGISPKTGYKWKKRYAIDGKPGLQDQSRCPLKSPNKLDESIICELVRLKNAHPRWGPAKIHHLFEMNPQFSDSVSLSSVKRVFNKAGLVKHRRKRRITNITRITNDVAAEKPNQLWTVDFKGSWYSCNNERIEPLTVRDAYSRYVLCSQALENSKAVTVKECFERLFTKYGLPEAIHSDNGSPFASNNSLLGLSGLSAWWIALGITINRSRPGKPQDNGGHEVMHRDLADAVEYTSNGNIVQQQREIDIWRKEFNEVRPHESLGMATPSDYYTKSTHIYESGDFELEYPLGYQRRLVLKNGHIKILSRSIFITTALKGWHVGLQPCKDGNYLLWFGNLFLGKLDIITEKLSLKAD